MFILARTAASSTVATSRVSVPNWMRSSTVYGVPANFRMVRDEPFTASGGMIALTREPSSRRASTSGEDSSMRRPTRDDDALDDAAQLRLPGETVRRLA